MKGWADGKVTRRGGSDTVVPGPGCRRGVIVVVIVTMVDGAASSSSSSWRWCGIVVPGPGCCCGVVVVCGVADAIMALRRGHRRCRGGSGGIVVPGPGCRCGIVASSSSSWRWWWFANAITAAASSSLRRWWWHRWGVASLNSMPVSLSGHCCWGNKSAVGLVWESEVVCWES